jgi:predicted ABC-type ATPase
MTEDKPNVVVISGPNGAGKSTSAERILRDTMNVTTFVNADTIARGLSGFEPDQAALAAGRIMLEQLRHLSKQRSSFAFETTLASRSFAPFLKSLVDSGYEYHLVFLWLPSSEMAVHRVQQRIREGGHAIPEDTIRRRYSAGLRNFFELYQPFATTWRIYDNSMSPRPQLIADGDKESVNVFQPAIWLSIQEFRHD